MKVQNIRSHAYTKGNWSNGLIFHNSLILVWAELLRRPCSFRKHAKRLTDRIGVGDLIKTLWSARPVLKKAV